MNGGMASRRLLVLGMALFAIMEGELGGAAGEGVPPLTDVQPEGVQDRGESIGESIGVL